MRRTSMVVSALAILLVLGLAAEGKEEAKPAPPAEPTREEVLLAEIRDLLKNRPA